LLPGSEEEHPYNNGMKEIINEIDNMIQEYKDRQPASVAHSESQLNRQIIDDLEYLKCMVVNADFFSCE
jgi:hypothetical protein